MSYSDFLSEINPYRTAAVTATAAEREDIIVWNKAQKKRSREMKGLLTEPGQAGERFRVRYAVGRAIVGCWSEKCVWAVCLCVYVCGVWRVCASVPVCVLERDTFGVCVSTVADCGYVAVWRSLFSPSANVGVDAAAADSPRRHSCDAAMSGAVPLWRRCHLSSVLPGVTVAGWWRRRRHPSVDRVQDLRLGPATHYQVRGVSTREPANTTHTHEHEHEQAYEPQANVHTKKHDQQHTAFQATLCLSHLCGLGRHGVARRCQAGFVSCPCVRVRGFREHNLYCSGEHPLYPGVKLDGSGGTIDMRVHVPDATGR